MEMSRDYLERVMGVLLGKYYRKRIRAAKAGELASTLESAGAGTAGSVGAVGELVSPAADLAGAGVTSPAAKAPAPTGRRVSMKAVEIEKKYNAYDLSMTRKNAVHEAVNLLEAKGYVKVVRLPFSDDIEKVILAEDRVREMEEFRAAEFGIASRSDLFEAVSGLLDEYRGRGELTDYYCERLASSFLQSTAAMNLEREGNLLRVLLFLQGRGAQAGEGGETLYIREASMLIFGDSKKFEREYRAAVERVIRDYRSDMEDEAILVDDEGNSSSDLLSLYGVIGVDQEVCLKGDFRIEFEDMTLHTKGFTGGISIAHADVKRIRKIVLQTPKFMTIENKTAFQRFSSSDTSAMYLGGFANRQQGAFLKRLYEENCDADYCHFGDIDIGGFLIHEHLVRVTGVPFSLYRMGIEELADPRFAAALQPLTENDRARAQGLLARPEYHAVVEYMLDRGVKLEQEIVALARSWNP